MTFSLMDFTFIHFFFQGVNLLKQASELWEEVCKLEEEALQLET